MEAYLNAEMAGLCAAMEAHIAADKKLAQDARLLRSIPGIGAGSASPAQPHRSLNQSKPPKPPKNAGFDMTTESLINSVRNPTKDSGFRLSPEWQ